MDTEPHIRALTQHDAGHLAVSGASVAAEVKVLLESGSGIIAMSEEVVEALQRQKVKTQTALTQSFVGHARVVTSLGQECDIVTQSCPLHQMIETPWGPVRFTMPFIVLPGGGDVVIIGWKTLREKLRIDVMTQLKASVLNAYERVDGREMEAIAGALDEPNAGAVLRAEMAGTAFGPGGGAPGDVDDDATLTLLSQQPIMLQTSDVEMHDRVGALGTAVDDAVDHELPPEYAKIIRDIVCRTHLDVFRLALLDDPPARVELMTVRLQPCARAVRETPRASPVVHIDSDENCWAYLLSRWVTRPAGPVCVHASVKYTEVLFAGGDKFPMKEVVHGVQAAAAEGGPTRDTAMGVASRDSEGLYRGEHHDHRVIWGAGRGRLSDEATVGVCPPGGHRTPRGRCDDGSA